jgi:hypothetical protein
VADAPADGWTANSRFCTAPIGGVNVPEDEATWGVLAGPEGFCIFNAQFESGPTGAIETV